MAVLGGQDKVYLKAALLVGILPEEDDPTLARLHERLRPVMSDLSRGTLSTARERLETDGNASLSDLRQFHRDFGSAYKASVLNMANTEAIELEDLPDGGCILSITVAHPREMTYWIRGWGPQVEVLAPQWLREQMVREAQETVKAYARTSDHEA